MPHAECAQRLLDIVDESEPELLALNDADTATPRAPGKWSPREILGHLIDSATNNHHRFVRAQAPGPFSFPPYAQDDWVARQAYNDRPWRDLVALWSAYNRHLAHVMAHCNPDELDTPCTIEYEEPVTLSWLMTDYLDHLNHHLAQILPQRKQEAVR